METFHPPFCPTPGCEANAKPMGTWYRPRGHYQPKCRAEPVPRFRCLCCGHSFSRQTFRHDYRDHRPEANVPLLRLLVSGVGLRQAGRNVDLGIRAVVKKVRKFAHTLDLLHGNLCPKLPEGLTFLLDEEESFETSKGFPVTMPVVIHRETWFVVATAVEPIRRLARKGSRLRRYQDHHEGLHGRREDRSRAAVRSVLQSLARRVAAGSLTMLTDEKSSYGRLLRESFGDRVQHLRTPGKAPRTVANPLFPINTTMAMTRDNNGRLRRRSWLHSKKRCYLADQLVLFLVYRNYMRRRFNYDGPNRTPAQMLGLLPRALQAEEALGWAQVWGARSPHPFSRDGSWTVGEARPANALGRTSKNRATA
jgi:hypothetical protein